MGLLAVVLVGVVASAGAGCVARPWRLRAFPECGDGKPVKILIHVECRPDGVCGYTCAPDRWSVPGEPRAGLSPVAALPNYCQNRLLHFLSIR